MLKQIKSFLLNKLQQEKHFIPGETWIKYSGPVFTINEYIAAIESILKGWFILGEDGRKFELEFSQYMGQKRGVFVNSGSSANLLMVHAAKEYFKVRRLITPVVCFPTTLNPLLQLGIEPEFIDVDLPSLNPSLEQAEKRMTIADGIIFAHVLGNPPNLAQLLQFNKGIFLEDACDALGSFYQGQKLGSFGELSTCSFFPAHHMTTLEGGFVATSNPKLERLVRSLRDWGRACFCNEKKPGDVTCGTACSSRFANWLHDGQNSVPYDHRYVFSNIGYNLKPLELQAAIGLQQIKKLDRFGEDRRRNFAALYKIFKPYEKYFMLPQATPGSDPCWFGFMLLVREDAPFNRTKFAQFLEAHKIQTRHYFAGNILYNPGYRHLAPKGNLKKKFPNADFATRASLFLGTYSGITQKKLDYIESVVYDFMQGV